MTQPLLEYHRSKKVSCWICNASERVEIEQAWDNGVRGSTIFSWLKDVKLYDDPPNKNQIRNHFGNNHK